MRNVEIKAKVRNLLDLIERARKCSGAEAQVIPQFDTFFNVPKGRFKLREFKEGNGELIFYQRTDQEGPKLSSFEKYDTKENVSVLKDVLTKALGIKGTVKKTRQLFLIGQTRVHVDSVDGLGDFMELEVVLSDEESVEKGENIAKDIMSKLGIEESDLLSCAYVDLLLGSDSKWTYIKGIGAQLIKSNVNKDTL